LGKKVVPNLLLLNNAIFQTEKKRPGLTESSYKSFIADKISGLNFKELRKDVEIFLEDKNELKLLDRDLILSMLSG